MSAALQSVLEPAVSADLTFGFVERETDFIGGGNITLGEGFDGCAERSRFIARRRTESIGNWRLRNVAFDPSTTLTFHNGEPVSATRYVTFPDSEAKARARIAAELLIDDAPRAIGRVFQGFNWLLNNHYHWIVQCVPAIASYARDPGFADGRLLLPQLSGIQEYALALSGVALPERLEVASSRPIRLEDLTVSTLLAGHEAPSPFCAGVFRRMAAALGPTPRQHRRIYVWRVDTGARPMTNEDDLADLLTRYDIEPVVLSTLPLDEQIQMFREARIVIGPHGAGLTNIVFCQPGTKVYELLPDHYVNPCFNRLAQMQALDYHADLHRAASRPGLWRHQTPWTVDLAAFERRLASVLRHA